MNKNAFLGLLFSLFFTVNSIYSQNIPHVYIDINRSNINLNDWVQIEIGVDKGDSIKSVLIILDYDENLFRFQDGTIAKRFEGATFWDIHFEDANSDTMLYLVAVTLGAGRYINVDTTRIPFFNLNFIAINDGEAVFKVDSLIFINPRLDYFYGTADSLVAVITQDTFPPDPVADFKVIEGNENLNFRWRSPTDLDFVGTRIFKSDEGFVYFATQENYVVYDGSDTTFMDTDVINNTLYYYSAFAYDEVKNYSTPVFLKAEPKEEFVYAYPNPFNPDELKVRFKTIFPYDTFVDIFIYDAVGQLVIELYKNKPIQQGGPPEGFELEWDGKNGNDNAVANGVYYYVVRTSQGDRIIDKVAVLR